MGSNDAREQLEAAKAECVWLERELAEVERGLGMVVAERDAALAALAAKVRRLDSALAVIEDAPHQAGCDLNRHWSGGTCDCWKSKADTSVLAARDAETRRQALEEATQAVALIRHHHRVSDFGSGWWNSMVDDATAAIRNIEGAI